MARPEQINEVLPVVAEVMHYVLYQHKPSNGKLTIVDLCSGVGYLSILLGELLKDHKDSIARFVLVDIMFPQRNRETKPHHINPDHIKVFAACH